MKKIGKLLKALRLILQKPALLNKVLDDADVNKQAVIRAYNIPHGLPSIDIMKLLPGFNEVIDPFCYLDGGSTPIDLALLKGLAKKTEGCEYLEIGTWRGESVTNVAEVAKHCTTINLPDSTMIEMGLDKKYVELHRFFSKDKMNITHIQADSQTFDFSSMGKKFDLIFIDGNHHFEFVMNDTRNAFKLLKDDKSMIVWHDYGNNPNDIRWDVLRGILEGTPNDQMKNLYRVSNTLCAIYTKENLPAYQQEKIETPNKSFKISITAKQL